MGAAMLPILDEERMNQDLSSTLAEMASNRDALVSAVRDLSAEDLEKARPGGWSAGRVLQHVIESEVAYVKLLAHLRGKIAPDLASTAPRDGADSIAQLERTRTAVLEMADGIDDETLYRMAAMGQNEYSALSVLENVADHDHEHLRQISRLFKDK